MLILYYILLLLRVSERDEWPERDIAVTACPAHDTLADRAASRTHISRSKVQAPGVCSKKVSNQNKFPIDENKTVSFQIQPSQVNENYFIKM